MFKYNCLNPIASVGLDLFSDQYEKVDELKDAQAALVRSAAMHDLELPDTLEAVARAGAGVNNIPLDKCADKGIVVFNTPGANANGVKELVLAGMLLASRDIVGGIEWVAHEEDKEHIDKLAEKQKKQFAALYDLYTDWNSKINVISRKDIENLYDHHVLHSLGIAQIIRFKPGTKIMDLGTGGGFPGIPLAILFPEVQFHLVDSIGKKVRVATEIANSIGLNNVTTRHARAEEEKQLFDFVVSRAVMPLADLLKIIRKNISPKQQNVFPNGLICLKGGELEKEAMPFKNKTTMWNLKEFFEEEFFQTKKVVYVSN